jgi:hypothetical protein
MSSSRGPLLLRTWHQCLRFPRANERPDQFERFVREVVPAADVKMIISEVGVTTNWSAAYTPDSEPQDAVVKVQLTGDRASTA